LIIWLLAALSLFDGSTLTGWVATGAASWEVDGGEIAARGVGDGFLATEAEYGDFRLQLEFWVDATTNSGVFIRCQDRQNIHPDTCYELNIWDEHPQQQARTGAIVFKAMPPLANVKTVGRWNTYDVLSRGSRIEVRVNGTLTATLDDANRTPGFIALQHWRAGEVRFRSLILTPLEN